MTIENLLTRIYNTKNKSGVVTYLKDLNVMLNLFRHLFLIKLRNPRPLGVVMFFGLWH